MEGSQLAIIFVPDFLRSSSSSSPFNKAKIKVEVTSSTLTTEVQEDVFTTEDAVQDKTGGVLL